MTVVLNRECSEVPFDKTKISNAILKAMKGGSGIVKPRIAERIADEIEEEVKDLDEITISEIEEKVYDKLVSKKQKLTAKAYYGYQKIREYQRENENTIDADIEELIEDQNDYWASENANKNPILNTTKRDYMAGIISTDATKRYLLPPDIVQLHNEGILHFHDADYFLQHMHNCFHKDTKFYTSDGIKTFGDFLDGDTVRILDKNGEFKTATIRYYGKRDMVKVKFSSYKKEKTVICTPDHRWLLQDGTITTNLKVGDKLLSITKPSVDLTNLSMEEQDWFTFGLCLMSEEIPKKYKDVVTNDVEKYREKKEDFLNSCSWKYLSEENKKWLFLGMYHANEETSICVTDKRMIVLMKDISFAAGYFISNEVRVKDTNDTVKYEISFISYQNEITCWKVENVKPYKENIDAWCLEEPTTHSFILDGGMITGNCDLINLEDMLQNGTVISEVLIEKPHTFSTACTVTTQIIAQVASNQYGGQSFSLEHLAPFVDISRQKIKKEVRHELKDILNIVNDDAVDKIVEERLKEEITKGIQTIQYQLTTIMTTNGQAPFVTIFMYLNEAKNKQEKHDLAMLIEEVLKQRIQGVKNEQGVFIAPAFPKLIYVTEEDNISEDTPYWYLTELAATCSSKRLVPDYISEKMMLELKGDVYTCMGCVDGNETITYQYQGETYHVSFEEMWERFSKEFSVKRQFENLPHYYMDLNGVDIYDTRKGFVNTTRLIRNVSQDWVQISFENGKVLTCTVDHPITLKNGITKRADTLDPYDKVYVHTDYKTGKDYSRVVKVEKIHKSDYSYDVTTDSEHFEVSGIYSHNCRSFLTPDRFSDKVGNVANAKNYEEGKHKYYGRFNCGVVTINLVDVALSSEGDEETFWSLFDERLNLAHKALRIRVNRLLGTKADVSPILWRYGALARLDKNEKIDKLIYNGYATLSLGYAGLYECVKYMTGHSHSDEGIGEEFGLRVMQHMNDKCNEWKQEENIDYSLYSTPLESTTEKFAKKLKERFGIIEGITDRNYITNSYHIPVFEEIDAFEKLRIEAKFQKLSPGGAISYIETPSMEHNVPALLEVIKYMYENIMYAEINTKSCYCEKCGYHGDIPLIDENNKLIWKCPNCGNTDSSTMDIAFRVCGYIGTAKNGANQGRYGDIHDRVYHIDDKECNI